MPVTWPTTDLDRESETKWEGQLFNLSGEYFSLPDTADV